MNKCSEAKRYSGMGNALYSVHSAGRADQAACLVLKPN